MADALVTVMISCVQREVARALTIPQLEAAGYPPRVFLSPCDPAGPASNVIVSLEALTWAAEQDASVLFVEDDIDLASDFGWHVQVARSLDAVTYLYLNDTETRLGMHVGGSVARDIAWARPIARGAYAIQKRAALFGTQCVVIPRRLAWEMVEVVRDPNPPKAPSPWDGRLHSWARRNPSEPVYVMLPNPVQHRADRTGRSPARSVMRSMSFGMPWVEARDPVVQRHRSSKANKALERQANLRAWRAEAARTRRMKHG